MARGWESKSVEAQQDEAARGQAIRPPLSPAERLVEEKRRTLILTRSRALADLGRATAPQHRRMLQEAIVALDEQLAQLTG